MKAPTRWNCVTLQVQAFFSQWSSHIFTHDRYNILSDILTEFEVNLGIGKYANT